ncbi:helix-turn-helix domain-containing protein [Undibacterium sp. Jales W-56]|uniref:GlxA family transcriptional regulator n=1 Tax=Undibacterium sp. Jales W-56 TaxID=2897325 RepID=UPI0021D1080F|nr:helix-turn-helix domain-containing protein [Undibacterium sp. Jales W-56]MCU6434313.1 helix-turn-helix domain-containing protein [Undibacterium sp. Jales W-56]
MNPPKKTIRIGILVYPGCLLSGTVVPRDVFSIANTLLGLRPAAQQLSLETLWLSAREQSAASINGLSFATQPLVGQHLDALMLPGIDHQSAYDITGRLALLQAEQAALRDYLSGDRLLIASCSATCLLANIGVLDGKRATTSWWLAGYFRQQYPQVMLEAEELIVQDGHLVSSGGLTSYIDLALWLVAHFCGESLRQLCAKMLVVDANRNSQAPYIASAMIQNQGHAIVERARRWLNKRLDQPWAMAELAGHCHTSQRTLLRRFQETLHLSPAQYVQQLRIERAKALLETTRLSLEELAGRCGYQDVSSLSKVFKQWTQVTPREYRQRFGLRS